MKMKPYQSYRTQMGVWLYPLCFVVIALSIHWLTGALRWPLNGSNEQRDFNTALGQTLFTGFFWVTIRAVHQTAGDTLANILRMQNAESAYSAHVRRLRHIYTSHVFWSMSFGVIMPVAYMVNEGLITRFHEPAVFTIALSAIAFWLLFATFLLQVSSNTQYILRVAIKTRSESENRYQILQRVFDMSISNTLLALSGLGLLPIFWINKPIPVLDFIVTATFVTTVMVYTCWPTFKTFCLLHTTREQLKSEITRKIDKLIKAQATSNTANNLSVKIEALQSEFDSPFEALNRKQKIALRLVVVFTLVSWCAVYFW